MPTIKLQIPC